jgi:hypothetical protein
VAPIAANREPVDFVIVSFGLAVSVIDEDQQEVEIEMREEGHSPAEIASALEVAGAAELRDMGAKYRWGTPFRYDPLPTLRADRTPQLWILGGEDYEAPSAETSRRIKSLIVDGRPFTLAVYPRAEHGMTLFETAPDNGERLSTRYAPDYFAMIRDYARDGRLHGAYGDAAITKAGMARATPTQIASVHSRRLRPHEIIAVDLRIG